MRPSFAGMRLNTDTLCYEYSDGSHKPIPLEATYEITELVAAEGLRQGTFWQVLEMIKQLKIKYENRTN